MSDIAERLKSRHAYEAKHYPPPDDLWLQAAAEITRLRSLVEEAKGVVAYYAGPHEFPSDGPWGANSTDFGSRAIQLLPKLKGEA